MSLHICVIEDDRTVSDHLSQILKRDSRVRQVYFASNKAEAIHCIKSCAVDVFLLDIGLPDVDGQDLIPVITEHQPDAKIVILTTFSASRYILSCFQKGAHGYLLKHEVSPGIVEKLLQTVNGNAPVSPEVSKILVAKLNQTIQPRGEKIAAKLANFGISEKEAEVLQYLAQGLSIEAIAARICKSTHTVNLHLRSIYKKLEVHSRGAAVHIAITEGLVDR